MRDLVTLADADSHTDPADDTPRALLGLDEADRPVWWTPTVHGNARFVSAAGAGRTTMLRSLVLQVLRYCPAGTRLVGTASGGALRLPDPTPAPVTVLDAIHGGEWAPLAAASSGRVKVAPATDADAVRDTLADLAALVGQRDVDRRRGPRFLVVDGAQLVRRVLDEAALEHLGRIITDGPAVGLYTLDAWQPTDAAGDVPPWTGVLALAGLGGPRARRLVGGDAVPAMSSHPRGRWAVHTDATGWTTVQGVYVPADQASPAPAH